MPIYTIHTEETVHGVYEVEAQNLEEVYDKFVKGQVNDPKVYEATDAKIDYVEGIDSE